MEKKLGDGLFRLLAPSVAGLLACVVCLCATSWAWFSASVTAAATTIRSASYTVSVTVQQGENDPVPVAASENGEFSVPLSAGDNTITLTPTGNANFGYCVVEYNGTTYYTDQLTTGSLSFTITAAAGELLTITPTWGTYTGEITLKNNDILGTPSNDLLTTADPPENDAEPADQPDGEDESESTDETNQPDEDPSGDSEPTTPGDNTPAEGDSGTNTGDSGDSAPASNATTPDATSASEPAPSASDGASEPTA